MIIKDYQPLKVRIRHEAIMEALLSYPEKNQNELAEMLGYTASRFSIIVNSPLFQLAYKEYRKEHRTRLSELIVEATTEAVRFNQEVIKNPGVSIELKQVSAKDILNQGHAKAVDRTASIRGSVEIPLEALRGLASIIDEASQPLQTSRKLLKTPEESSALSN